MDIFLRVASHPPPEGAGKPAWAAESVLLRDLGDGIPALGQKLEALPDPVVGEVLGDGLPGHLFEEAAHRLTGQMDVFCQALKGNGFLVMSMQIIQEKLKPSEVFLVRRKIETKVVLFVGQDLKEDAQNQAFDLELEAVGMPGEIVVHLIEIRTEMLNPRFFGV